MLTPTPFSPTASADPIAEVRVRVPRVLCSGDPYDLTGGAHLWSEFGEDDRGTIYRCDVCGVTDVGP